MASVWIEQWQSLSRDTGGSASPIPAVFLGEEVVTISGTSSDSPALHGLANFVCLTGDAAFHFEIGASPTASTSTRFVPANVPRFYPCRPGQVVAIIQTS